MALQDILQKILQEAKKQVSEIEKDFQSVAEKLKEESKEMEASAIADLNDRKSKTLEKLTLETETMANREKKKILLGAKNELIEKSLQALLNHLTSLSDKDYTTVLSKMIEGIDLSEGELRAPSAKAGLLESVAPSGFSVKKDDTVSSGFVFVSKGVEIDNTFENLVFSEFRSDLESFFAQKLALI